MHKRVLAAVLVLAASAASQNLEQIYGQAVRPALRQAGVVENVDFDWDALHFTLESGTLALGAPIAGHTEVAVFRGRGTLTVHPPNPVERQQIRFFRGADTIVENFTEAVFRFGDGQLFLKALDNQVRFRPLATEGELGATLDARVRRLRDLGRWQALRAFDAANPGSRIFYAELGVANRNPAAVLADGNPDADRNWVVAEFDPLAPEPVRVHAWEYRAVPALNPDGLPPAMMNTAPGADLGLHKPSQRLGRGPTCLPPLAFKAGRLIFNGFDDTWTQFGAGPIATAPFEISRYRLDISGTRNDETVDASVALTITGPSTGLLLRLDTSDRILSAAIDGTPAEWLQPQPPGPGADPAQFEGNWVYVGLPGVAPPGTARELHLRYHRGAALVAGADTRNVAWYPLNPFAPALRPAVFEVSTSLPGEVAAVADDQPATAAGLGVGGLFSDFAAQAGADGHVTVRVPAAALQAAALQPGGTDQIYVREAASAFALLTQWFGKLARPPVTLTLDPGARAAADRLGNLEARVEAIPGAVRDAPARDDASWPGLVGVDAANYFPDLNLGGCPPPVVAAQWREQIKEVLTPHEVAHQWWGLGAGWASYHDQWLAEGMANASALFFQEATFGSAHATATLRLWQRELLGADGFGHIPNDDGPLWLGRRLNSSLDPSGFETVTFDKGGYVISMLRQMMRNAYAADPDARFFAMMREYYAAYAGKLPATADFQAVVERHMTSAMNVDGNGSMDWFFQNYVYGTLIPRLVFHATWAPAATAGKWRVSVRVENPDQWRGLLPVYTFEDATHYDRGEMRISGPENTIAFEIPFAPTQVDANHFEDMLVRLEAPRR